MHYAIFFSFDYLLSFKNTLISLLRKYVTNQIINLDFYAYNLKTLILCYFDPMYFNLLDISIYLKLCVHHSLYSQQRFKG